MKHYKYIIGSLFAFVFIIFGVVAVLQPQTSVLKNINIPIGDAIKWFGFAVIASAIPFLEEISISGVGIKLLKALKKTNVQIDNLELIIENQKNESRTYLIDTFNEYLNTLTPEDQTNKIINLNNIYFKELDVRVIQVKKGLNKWLKMKKDSRINKIMDLSEVVNAELIEALKVFQEDQKIENHDGIFGYYTCDKLKKYFDQNTLDEQ